MSWYVHSNPYCVPACRPRRTTSRTTYWPFARGVFARAVDPDDRLHRIKALDGLLRSQLAHFQDDTQSEAARVLFGLAPGARGTSLTQRRSRAAVELHCNEAHFRKRIEPKIVRQLAWQLHQDTQTYVPRARDVPPTFRDFR